MAMQLLSLACNGLRNMVRSAERKREKLCRPFYMDDGLHRAPLRATKLLLIIISILRRIVIILFGQL